ncbi:MAG: beta-ketoacyl-ACP synthase II [Candidatus Hydrogenedentota bacterium]
MRRVVITGFGVVTPIGNDVKSMWQSILESRSGTARLTAFDPTPFSSHVAAEVKNFDPLQFFDKKEARRMDRFVQFAMKATIEAMEMSGIDLSKENLDRIGVIVGSGIGGLNIIEKTHSAYLEAGPKKITPLLIPMLIINMASGMIAMRYGLRGPNESIVTACASATHSIGDAFKVIQRGDADIMVAGGTEAATTPLGFGGFCSMGALSTRNDQPEKASRPFDKNRDGFVMGEGAGILILEEYEHSKKRNAEILAEICGYGLTCDAYHITAPDPNAYGATKCMENALLDARIDRTEVDYINAHGTSTDLNDKLETLAIKNLFTKEKSPLVSSTKSNIGHLLGAAGAAEAVVCILAIKNKIVPPTINYETPDPECDLDYVPNLPREKELKVVMSNSFGFGGHNATLVFRKI